MNYIGSKVALLPFPEKHIPEFSGFPSPGPLVDIFAGTGAVGKHFRQPGRHIIAPDIQYYSYYLNRAGRRNSPRQYFTQYFTDANRQPGDTIRRQIEDWREKGLISEDEYFYLPASLPEAMDRVANPASVDAAFLKRFQPATCRHLPAISGRTAPPTMFWKPLPVMTIRLFMVPVGGAMLQRRNLISATRGGRFRRLSGWYGKHLPVMLFSVITVKEYSMPMKLSPCRLVMEK